MPRACKSIVKSSPSVRQRGDEYSNLRKSSKTNLKKPEMNAIPPRTLATHNDPDRTRLEVKREKKNLSAV